MIRNNGISAGLAVAGLLGLAILATPGQARAWWRGGYGVGIWIPPVVVAPPVYAPPPVYYAAPPAVVYAPPPVLYASPPQAYTPPARYWVPPHWEGGYWVSGHWA